MWNTLYEKDNECAKQKQKTVKNTFSFWLHFCILAHKFTLELNSETEQLWDKEILSSSYLFKI